MSILTLIAIVAISIFFTVRRELRRSARKTERATLGIQAMNLPPTSHAAFIVCTFSMLGKLAEADGEVSEDEIRRVEKYMDSELKLDGKTKALALDVFKNAAASPLELRDYAEKFQSTFPDSVQRIDKIVEILVEVSAADGILAPSEERLIRSAALLLGVTEPAFERIKSRHVRPDILQ